MERSWIGDSVLLFVTICWGVTFPLIENAVKQLDPAVFVTVRFLLAALILLPFILYYFQRKSLRGVLKAGIILAILNVIAYMSQTIGMETATSAQGAFITGINVILVPFFLPFFRLGKPTPTDIICSLFCFLGLYLLTGTGHVPFNIGEIWLLVCAFFYGLTIVYLQKVSLEIKNLSLLAFLQIIFTGFFTSFLTINKSYANIFNPHALIAILFCSIFATSIAILLQTKFQHYTTANRAAMIFCLEPVFGSLFGYLINGEKLGWSMLTGGLVILMSIVFSELWRFYRRSAN